MDRYRSLKVVISAGVEMALVKLSGGKAGLKDRFRQVLLER
jgi:hypothetical protein